MAAPILRTYRYAIASHPECRCYLVRARVGVGVRVRVRVGVRVRVRVGVRVR